MALFVSRDFKNYIDDRLLSFGNTVYQMMSVDDKYPAFQPYFGGLNDSKAAFVIAIANAVPGGRDRIDDKKNARLSLISILENLAFQIERTPNVTERFIIDAGFEVRKTKTQSLKTPITEIDMPTNFVAVNVNKPGCANLKWGKVKNRVNYGIRFKPLAETVWQNGIYNDKNEYNFTNLQSATVYEFEVCTIGPDGLVSDFAKTTPVYVS